MLFPGELRKNSISNLELEEESQDSDLPKIPDESKINFVFLKKSDILLFHGAICFCHWRRGLIF